MADFPTALTNAVDNTTDILAKHLNNLEVKVGINSSADSTSLDYGLRSASSVDPGHTHTTGIPTGVVFPVAQPIVGANAVGVPTGYLLCNGQAVSRTTYASLFSLLNTVHGTCTISNGAAALVTINGHGLNWGSQVYFTTTGALPTGLSVNTIYWVVYVDGNTFRLATTIANAMAATTITTSSAGSGVHTMVQSPYGLGNGSTTFNVPNLVTRVIAGQNPGTGWEFTAIGTNGIPGASTVTLTTATEAAHTHDVNIGSTASGGITANHQHVGGRRELASYASGHTAYTGNRPWGYSSDGDVTHAGTVSSDHAHYTDPANTTSTSVGSNGAHLNMQPTIIMNYIIKT